MKNDERRGVSKRTVAILLALVLVIGCAVGGTLAWLTAKTDDVTNTFTYGDINIDLKEHSYDADNYALKTGEANLTTSVGNYKIIPGVDLPKDPFVTVRANSEKCYVFIQENAQNWPTFKEEDGTTDKVGYSIITGDNGWAQLKDKDNNPVAGVYYKIVDASDKNQTLNILVDNKVTVSQNLTKAEVGSIAEAKKSPTLSFTAYAVQYQKSASAAFTAAEAWAIANSVTP